MRFTAGLTFVSLLSSVSAGHYLRQLPGFPSCADDCLNDPTNLGGCAVTDESCLCNSLPFVQTTFACITAACQGSDQQSAISGAENLCLDFGVTLTAESSAIVAGLSTAAGASTTTVASQITSSTSSTAPTVTPNSAHSLFMGYFSRTTPFACIAAAAGLFL
ncbi:hypothetical protein DFH07DRAFT_821358 [Mycena maculata]|uniref:CFEM domain-containing protein n=1 Tax=Mycena maculata TaxID=230809 RepID=A0AAD7NDW3_9AGAR|nr:hypothetical protein DFH07DRAFT_821358 [Mycena maculata]